MTSLAECLDKAGEEMQSRAIDLRCWAVALKCGTNVADEANARAVELWFLRDFIASGGMDVLRKLYDFDQAARGYYRELYTGMGGDDGNDAHLAYMKQKHAGEAVDREFRGWAARHAEEFKLLRDKGDEDNDA